MSKLKTIIAVTAGTAGTQAGLKKLSKRLLHNSPFESRIGVGLSAASGLLYT
jgi:hypothetical protein